MHFRYLFKVRICCVLLLLNVSCLFTRAQELEARNDSSAIVTNSFWDNWYGQVGADMNLIFPYEENIADVFPNGKSFGVNVAVGKWFSPDFGGRFKINWGNGIFKNDHNTWLRPFGEPGANHRNGGYMTFIGDIQFNLHNLFSVYRPNRKWNLIVSPRVGGWLDLGSGKGCPVLGLGFVNTFRLNDKWRLYADIGYHFMASINNNHSSGTGHGSNGYADIVVGVEMDLSSVNRFYKLSSDLKNKREGVGTTGLFRQVLECR